MGRADINRDRKSQWVGDEDIPGEAPSAPEAPRPITCGYCGGPVGADETHCPECGAKAVRCGRCGGAHLACLPVVQGVTVHLDPPIVGIPITELAKRKP